jgi:hypothetical protein
MKAGNFALFLCLKWRRYIYVLVLFIRVLTVCAQRVVSRSARITNKVMGSLKIWRSTARLTKSFWVAPKGSPNIAKEYTLLLQAMLSLLTYYPFKMV